MTRILSSLFAVLFLSLLFVSVVSAELIVNTYTNDFAVSSAYDLELKACACENKVEQLTVTNTGGFTADYTLSLLADDSVLPWLSAPRRDFTLTPGESKTLLVYAEPGCDTVGTYSYAIKIASGYGRERILNRVLDVRQCQNIFLTVEGTNRSNLCGPLDFTARLKNVAEFPDTYHLDLGSFNGFANYTRAQQDNYLVPNEERDVSVRISPPCGLYGDLEIPFTITSDKNKVTEQRLLHVFIENQFDHEIVAKTKAEFCSRVPSIYTFSVKNLINVSNDYDVIITGPGFMDYETKELHLAGLEEKEVTVALAPQKGDEGAYELHVRVISKLGDIRKSRDVQIDVFDCFAYDVGFVDQPKASDGSYADTACCGEKTYTLNIRNNGQTAEAYDIQVDGPSWFAPEEKTIRLDPGENRNVKFTARLPCSDNDYSLPVRVSLVRHPAIAEELLFKLQGQTQQTCHAVDVRTGTVRLDEETTVVPFFLRHTGLEGGAYEIELDGELFNGSLEQEITLEPGEEKVLHFTTKANLTDYFDGKYQNTLTVTYTPQDLVYKSQFWTNLVHVSWFTKLWRTVVNYQYATLPPCFWAIAVLFLVALLATVWLIVLLNRERRPRMGKGALVFVRVALALALIGALLFLFLTPLPEGSDIHEQRIDDASGLVFQWYENERFTVDLSRYYADLDNDTLEFTATQPAHVAVTIAGSEATLSPELNWAGTDRIVFTASDKNGGVTDSPIIDLRVLRRDHLGFLQWLVRYCFQIVLSEIALVLLLLLLIALRAQRRTPVVVTPPRAPNEPKRSVYTVVRKDGAVQTLGANAKGPKATRPARKTAQTQAAKPASRALTQIAPGQVFTYKDAQGKTQTLGVAERMVWPAQQAEQKGSTVNIAVGAHAVGGAAAAHGEFVLVGAKSGNKVHTPQCVIAQKIPRKNRVSFTSKKDALVAGYGPCKVCQSFDKA